MQDKKELKIPLRQKIGEAPLRYFFLQPLKLLAEKRAYNW